MAVWYCEEVVAGRVPACRYEVLACERFLRMRREAMAGGPVTWSDAHVIDACAFIEKLPHIKAFTGTIVLEPVQCWWMAAIFGFRERGTGLRWVRNVRLWVPRKNAKTSLSVGITLFCTNFEGEPGAEAVISAGSEAQAGIPFGAIRKTLEIDEELAEVIGAHCTRDEANFEKTGGVIKLAHSRAKNLDGLNPHVLLQEELHAQDQAVIGVLKTAQGARQAPLDLGISTAGRDINSAAYDDWKACVAVLEGRLKAPRQFVAMYAGEDEEKARAFDLTTVERLNPLWGVSLNPVAIEEEIAEARKSEAKRQEYLRTRLNIWSRAAGNLISVEAWERCGDPALTLDALKGYPLFVGIDLASRSDLNTAQYLSSVEGCAYLTGDYWLCEEAERLKDDRFADDFLAWAEQGWLELTPGSFIDYKVILKRILARLEGHKVIGVGLDDYQANLMAKEIEEAGYAVFIVRKNARSLTPSTEDIIARVNDPALFQHDGNPLSAWCAGNVVGHWDANDNVLPKKERKGSKANIDGFDGLVIANALRLDHEAGVLGQSERERQRVNPYLERGLAGGS
ncbi:terminase large subunit [Phenylobacterium sp.]|uniref:terminase large subunit n=1 Tax=Phenylobacterium sp. TaxID=1871053 RepID=UPI00392E535A